MALTRKNFYKSNYVTYSHDPRRETVKRIVSALRGGVSTLLDIGSGDGEYTRFLMEAAGISKGYVVDLSPIACAMARERGLHATCLDLDEMERLPFDSAVFDVVHAGQVIEHVFNTDLLLSEIHRVLRPEGVCVISTPNLAAWYNRLLLLLGSQPINTAVSMAHFASGKPSRAPAAVAMAGAEHLRTGTHRAWTQLFPKHGFVITRTTGTWTRAAGMNVVLTFAEAVFSAIPSLASVLIYELKRDTKQI